MKVDKIHILKELKDLKKFRSNAEFARFLSITPQCLSTWLNRNTFDINKIERLFPEVKTSWLLTGEGPMLKELASGDLVNNTIIGGNIKGSGNQISQHILAHDACQKEVEHLKAIIDEKNKQLADKERLIELLLNKK